jgi:hypothetical protein
LLGTFNLTDKDNTFMQQFTEIQTIRLSKIQKDEPITNFKVNDFILSHSNILYKIIRIEEQKVFVRKKVKVIKTAVLLNPDNIEVKSSYNETIKFYRYEKL